MSDFKKLLVWQKAHALAVRTHRVTTGIRRRRRQDSEKDFARFLRYALNSAFELEYHLLVAQDIQAIPEEDAASLLSAAIEVRKMLFGLLYRVAPKPLGS